MCGLVGYVDYTTGRGIASGAFGRLVDTLAHRGPDDRGVYEARGLGLGHRRLSIIDTSTRGRQPMGSPDRQVWLVYNGEIYNFPTLKQELERKGHSFVSTSDTEVLLHAYLEWGLDCLPRLNGIFAFAIWDERRRRLWLVRDPIGVKPLYYSDYQGTLSFASEISTLLAFPHIPRTPDPQGIDAYFTFSYIPAPLTGYKHVRQLLPGQYLLLEGDRQQTQSYWDVPWDRGKLEISEQECIAEFDRLFTETVRRQMVSDVPLGAFLSGGTDSFAVLRSMRQATGEVTAFSISFDDPRYDEFPYTQQAAAALGVKLIGERLGLDLNHLLHRVAPYCRDPFADSSCLPVYLLCELASRHVKVALSGDGADELLAGYAVYQANRYARIYRKIPHFIREGIIKPLSRLVPELGGRYTYREKVRRFIYGAEQGKYRDHASWRVLFPQELKKDLYTPEFWREVKDFDPIKLYTAHIELAKDRGCTDLASYLYADLRFYLPNDMLVKVDRMSMAHGLEVRVPFLDLEMVDYCWRLPDNLKLANGTTKYILREVIRDLYPRALQKLPKSGFNMAPHQNFLPPMEPRSRFYDFSRLRENSLFGNYGSFLLRYAQFIFEQAQKEPFGG